MDDENENDQDGRGHTEGHNENGENEEHGKAEKVEKKSVFGTIWDQFWKVVSRMVGKKQGPSSDPQPGTSSSKQEDSDSSESPERTREESSSPGDTDYSDDSDVGSPMRSVFYKLLARMLNNEDSDSSESPERTRPESPSPGESDCSDDSDQSSDEDEDKEEEATARKEAPAQPRAMPNPPRRRKAEGKYGSEDRPSRRRTRSIDDAQQMMDQGKNVREKAKHLVALLSDDDRLKNERAKAIKAKERFAQNSFGMGNAGPTPAPAGKWQLKGGHSDETRSMEGVEPPAPTAPLTDNEFSEPLDKSKMDDDTLLEDLDELEQRTRKEGACVQKLRRKLAKRRQDKDPDNCQLSVRDYPGVKKQARVIQKSLSSEEQKLYMQKLSSVEVAYSLLSKKKTKTAHRKQGTKERREREEEGMCDNGLESGDDVTSDAPPHTCRETEKLNHSTPVPDSHSLTNTLHSEHPGPTADGEDYGQFGPEDYSSQSSHHRGGGGGVGGILGRGHQHRGRGRGQRGGVGRGDGGFHQPPPQLLPHPNHSSPSHNYINHDHEDVRGRRRGRQAHCRREGFFPPGQLGLRSKHPHPHPYHNPKSNPLMTSDMRFHYNVTETSYLHQHAHGHHYHHHHYPNHPPHHYPAFQPGIHQPQRDFVPQGRYQQLGFESGVHPPALQFQPGMHQPQRDFVPQGRYQQPGLESGVRPPGFPQGSRNGRGR